MLRAGRARGSYLARTYEYTDPLLPRIWELGQRLLRARCWAQNHLLGQVVRLDHLVTVFDHFYEGPEVAALVADFDALKLELNRDSVELFEHLIRACQRFEGAALDARASELLAREAATRDGFQRRLCALNDALHRRALSLVGLPYEGERPRAPRRAVGNLPRHAAAALLAAGLVSGAASGCGGEAKTEEARPDGIAGAAGAGAAASGGEGGVDAAGGSGGYVN
ncbi:MAG TPA: hypothetical protein PLU22_09185, partial [Polyangiaceae bacterium]|nr:hypothetical protein [Polyangiaceae bacterium]